MFNNFTFIVISLKSKRHIVILKSFFYSGKALLGFGEGITNTCTVHTYTYFLEGN